MFNIKKIRTKNAVWKGVLNEIYNNAPEQYYIDYFQSEEDRKDNYPDQLHMNQDVICITLRDGKVDFKNNKLKIRVGLSTSELIRNLLFLFSNDLIETENIYNISPDEEHASNVVWRADIKLTKKGFDVALENQKQEKTDGLSLSNTVLAFYATLFTAALVATSITDLVGKFGASANESIFVFCMLLALSEAILFLMLYFGWKFRKYL